MFFDSRTTKKPNMVLSSTAVSVVDAEKDQRPLLELDYPTWLPFAAKTYCISPNIKDYVLVTTPICPSDIPNRNGIAFPLNELTKFQPPPISRMAYKAWAGCPVHYEHCFDGNTKIRTSRGLKDIAKIEVGEKVLTHKGRYRKVTKVFENGTKQLYQIDAYGTVKPILATGNHPVWVVGRGQLFGAVKHNGEREIFKNPPPGHTFKPHWRSVTDVYPKDYLVVPLYIGGDAKVDPSFAFLTGLYAAEGNLSPTNRHVGRFTGAVFTLAYNEKLLMNKAIACAEALGLSWTKSYRKEGGTSTFVIHDAEFAQAMYDLIGVYSHTKRMKAPMRSWNNNALLQFLGGYISGDGSVSAGRLRCITVSQDLAQDLQVTMGRLGMPATANGRGWASMFTEKYTRRGDLRKGKGGKPWRDTTDAFCVSCTLQESGCLQPYLVNRGFNARKRIKDVGPCIIVREDFMLLPIASIKKVHKAEVFNLEVEEDHTYVAGGVIVHNCNEVHEDAYGVILDASLHKITGYGGGKLWKVMGLLAIDKRKYPEMAKRVLEKDINTYSMGAYVDDFTCSYCNEPMRAAIKPCAEYPHGLAAHHCAHVHPNNDINWKEFVDYDNSRHVAFQNAHGIAPIETSLVESPAWTTALSDYVMGGL